MNKSMISLDRPALVSAIAGMLFLTGCANTGSETPVVSARECIEIESLVKSAREDSFYGRYDRTVTKLQSALLGINNKKSLCELQVTKNRVQIDLALALSNQRKFLQAESIFSEISKNIDVQADEDTEMAAGSQDRELLRVALAQHELNKGITETDISVNASVRDQSLFADSQALTDEIGELGEEEVLERLDLSNRFYVNAYRAYLLSDLSSTNNDKQESLKRINEARVLIDNAISVARSSKRNTSLYVARYQLLQAKILLQQGQLMLDDDRQSAIGSFNAANKVVLDALKVLRRDVSDLIAGRSGDELKDEGALVASQDDSTIVAQAEITRARILIELSLADQGISLESAVDAFETGIAVYSEYPSPVRLETLWPYFEVQLKRAWNDEARRPEIFSSMFEAAQVIRGSITSSELTSSTAALSVSPSLDNRKRQLIKSWQNERELLDKLKRQLSSGTQSEFGGLIDAEKLSVDLRRTEENVARLREKISREAPEYAERIDKPVSVSAIQKKLGANDIFIYSVLREPCSTGADCRQKDATAASGLIFAIDTDGVNVIRVRDISVLENLVYELKDNLRFGYDPEGRRAITYFDWLKANLLFDELLPADLFSEERIQAFEQYDSVYFVASGALKRFPLEALVTTLPEDQDELEDIDFEARQSFDYFGINWLDETHTVSYPPSPRVFFNLKEREVTPKQNIKLFAGGDFVSEQFSPTYWIEATDLGEACLDRATLISKLPTLKGTEEELNAIEAEYASSFDSEPTILRKDKFTEKKIAEEKLDEFDILHFATHGLLVDSIDCEAEPSLAVSFNKDLEGQASTSTKVKSTPGLLTTSEIRDLPFSAVLVVLSACDSTGSIEALASNQSREETRLSDASAGESLSGLARAFFLSNAKAVIASHWKVDDLSAQRMMTEFYSDLFEGEGATVSSALKAARFDIREEPDTSHPIFWAPFVVVGDGNFKLRN